MAKYRIVHTNFWNNPIISEEMSPEDKYFYLYLLTNPNTTQIGIYKITKKQMAFDLGYSIESVHSLMERFTLHYKLIRYNPETRELAIKNWGKDNLNRSGKPVMDCIYSELKEVEDPSLIQYVAESIQKQEIRTLFESFCVREENGFDHDRREQDEINTYNTEYGEIDDTLLPRYTIGGQKEKQKEKEKQKQKQQQKQQQKAFQPNRENPREIENLSQRHQSMEENKEIIEYWDSNGFDVTNVNAKQLLLSWINDSSFLQPKEVILKAMNIAFANSKRCFSYVVGILINWVNESLLNLEEIDSYHGNPSLAQKNQGNQLILEELLQVDLNTV
ncbi:DnaD domain protein [Neobacillus mesonae]|nr:DnaD domain protein [Neobacillus mesonae]